MLTLLLLDCVEVGGRGGERRVVELLRGFRAGSCKQLGEPLITGSVMFILKADN